MFKRAILILLLLASQSLAANKYVRSTDGNDADDGSTWALAKATLAGAFSAASAGDTIYVSDNHAETQASAMTLTSPGTAASPCRVLCGDDAAEPPTALATTATISTTGANNITFSTGHSYFNGITFCAGDGSSACQILCNGFGTTGGAIFENCTLKLGGSGSGNIYTPNGASTGLLLLINTKLHFSHAGQSLVVRGRFDWRDTPSALPGTVVSNLIYPSLGTGPTCTVSGVDLSQMTSGNIVQLHDANGGPTGIELRNCKIHSGATLFSGTPNGRGGCWGRAVNCDSADTNYRYQKTNYQGTITQETTIVRTGGATDGTTPVSRKMVSTANSKYFSPLESDPILYWNETTGSSVTVTIPVITDNVTLTDAEAWIEVEYLGTSGFPIASTSTDRSTDVLASASNQTTDATSTWTTTGLTTPVKQELSVTFTPQEKGVIRARVMLAKASTTMYFDPEILTTSGRTYMVGADGQVNEGASGSNTIDPLSETIPGL